MKSVDNFPFRIGRPKWYPTPRLIISMRRPLTQARESFCEQICQPLSASRSQAMAVRHLPRPAHESVVMGSWTRAALLLLGKPGLGASTAPPPRANDLEAGWFGTGPMSTLVHPFFAIPPRCISEYVISRFAFFRKTRWLLWKCQKYDRKVVLEALHNCIAHQDYSRNGRIVVTERRDRLTFENEGDFF